MKCITRQEAKKSGLKFYFTGKPCKHGHISERITSNGKCYCCSKSQASDWKKSNRDRLNKYLMDWYDSDPTRRATKYRNDRKGTSTRRAKKLLATPYWSESERIKEVYKKAAKFGLHVDHIVPLKSSKVCGLHVWHNLQLLAPDLNQSKSNREWPDMP